MCPSRVMRLPCILTCGWCANQDRPSPAGLSLFAHSIIQPRIYRAEQTHELAGRRGRYGSLSLLPASHSRRQRALPALRELSFRRRRAFAAFLVVHPGCHRLPAARGGLCSTNAVNVMANPLITLTTDFGSGSHYVAAAKGVILALNSDVRIVDLSHDIPAQDLRQTAFFLTSTLHYFPPETLHVVIVDPGVGSQRSILYIELDNLRVLVPDNGCWTWLMEG